MLYPSRHTLVRAVAVTVHAVAHCSIQAHQNIVAPARSKVQNLYGGVLTHLLFETCADDTGLLMLLTLVALVAISIWGEAKMRPQHFTLCKWVLCIMLIVCYLLHGRQQVLGEQLALHILFIIVVLHTANYWLCKLYTFSTDNVDFHAEQAEIAAEDAAANCKHEATPGTGRDLEVSQTARIRNKNEETASAVTEGKEVPPQTAAFQALLACEQTTSQANVKNAYFVRGAKHKRAQTASNDS